MTFTGSKSRDQTFGSPLLAGGAGVKNPRRHFAFNTMARTLSCVMSAENVLQGCSTQSFSSLTGFYIVTSLVSMAVQHHVYSSSGFDFPEYITLLTMVSHFLQAAMYVYNFNIRPRASWPNYITLSLCTYSGVTLTNHALRFLDFPARIILKSSKILPTLVFSSFILRKVYSPKRWVAAMFLVVSSIMVTLGGTEVHPHFAQTGTLLITTAVCIEAFASNFEESALFRCRQPSTAHEAIYFTSCLGTIYALIELFTSKNWRTGYIFFSKKPRILIEVLASSFFGYVSMATILTIVARYGATEAEVAKYFRRVLTLMGSFALFENRITPVHATGFFLFVLSSSALLDFKSGTRLNNLQVEDANRQSVKTRKNTSAVVQVGRAVAIPLIWAISRCVMSATEAPQVHYSNVLSSHVTFHTSVNGGRVRKTADAEIVSSPQFQSVRDSIRREVCVLRALQRFPWCPRLLEDGPDFLVTSYVGHPINLTNLPDDWFRQMIAIVEDMHSVGVAHNAIINPRQRNVIETSNDSLVRGDVNFMVLDGTVYLTDVGMATLNRSQATCTNISDVVPDTVRNFDDGMVPYVLREFVGNARESKDDFEIHLLIDWSKIYSFQSFSELLPVCLHVVAIHYRESIRNETERLWMLQRFYRVPLTDDRFKADHIIYVLNDTSPVYDWRNTNGGHRRINTNIFDLKMKLRKQNKGLIHATDNIEETRENMHVLHIPYGKLSKRLFGNFSTLKDVFETLNAAIGLQYIVLRDFDSLLMEKQPNIDEHDALQLLVNDYFKVKRMLDAESTTGDTAEETGGGRVRNRFKVGGNWIYADIRYVGDHYLDVKWQKNMLHSSKRVHWISVPERENLRHSRLYQWLVHNITFFPTDIQKIKQEFHTSNRTLLMSELAAWMLKHRYNVTRPSDPSVSYTGEALRALVSETCCINE